MKCKGCGYVTQGDEIHCCRKGNEMFIITDANLAPPPPAQRLEIHPCDIGIGEVDRQPLHIYAPGDGKHQFNIFILYPKPGIFSQKGGKLCQKKQKK